MDDALIGYLAEDVGLPAAGLTPQAVLERDVTSQALPPKRFLRAHVVARAPCIAAGVEEARAIFEWMGATVVVDVPDGRAIKGNTVVLTLQGPAERILTAERVALNLLMRMSGIATLTNRLQRLVHAKNPKCRVAATRKTTPGFRAFEKRAVALGGGDPHRSGLWDAFLIKDNHLKAAPDVAEAVQRCRERAPDLFLQVEADEPTQAFAAARAGADAVLLDNFTPDTAAATYRALKLEFPDLLVEVSGGITEGNVADYALGADRISLGMLTHSVRAVDFGLDVESA